MSQSHDLPPELLDAARALEEHRPRLSELELAGIKRRIAGPAPAQRTRPQGGFMKSRLAITALLAAGALMSSGGAALGVSALSTDLTASSAQYGAPTPQADEDAGAGAGGTLGDNAGGRPEDAGGGDVAGVQDSGVAQPARQVAASQGEELPFTGYAAIPLLLVGLALLASGLVLRRSTHDTLRQT